MDSKELRLGNYVFTQSDKLVKELKGERSRLYQIETINAQSGDKYDPIPLTEEWLIKFGFENKQHGVFDIEETFFELIHNNSIGFRLSIEGQYGYPELKYVHQLQNLYFVLTGEELKSKSVIKKGTLSYKGLTGSIEFSEEDKVWFGKVDMERGLISYEGNTLEELQEGFKNMIDHYLSILEDSNIAGIIKVSPDAIKDIKH